MTTSEEISRPYLHHTAARRANNRDRRYQRRRRDTRRCAARRRHPRRPHLAACIGVGLGLLDDWLTGHCPDTPTGLATRARLPDGHWLGERAATDIFALAHKRRAFDAQNQLIIGQRRPQHALRRRASRSPAPCTPGPASPATTSPTSPASISPDPQAVSRNCDRAHAHGKTGYKLVLSSLQTTQKGALRPQAKLRAHRQHSATGVDRNTPSGWPFTPRSQRDRINPAAPCRNAPPAQFSTHHGRSEARPKS